MLHAFARNKSSAYKRYLGVRDPSEPRVSSEDEITSLLFGPLDFLPASDSWKLWALVLQSHASKDLTGPLPSDYFSDTFSPDSCTLEFWPRKANVEPDLHITFADRQGITRSILVELKWGAGISGEDQLEKQWLRYQRGAHASSLHVFIAKHMEEMPADRKPWRCVEADGSPSSRFRAMRWHEFRHQVLKLAALPGTSVQLKRWCILASGFLRQVGIRPFVGFHATVALAEAILDQGDEREPFWVPGI